MPEDDDETARRVRKLVVEHAETRWLALHMDNDIQEIRGELREVRATQQAHTARFDSIDSQMRSLTQMVGEVLKRLPAPDENGD